MKDTRDNIIPASPGINKDKYSILQGSIPTALIRLAWPVMIASGMQVVYNLADTFWLGRVSAEAVAAISMGFPIVFLLISIGAGMTVAGTALVAQYTGAGKKDSANEVAGQLLTFLLSIAIIISITGVLSNKFLLELMGTPKEVLPMASGYLNVIFAGLFFMFAFFVFESLLRGVGDTKTPMKLKIFSAGFNILLDPFLIFGLLFFPRLEVMGAAYATIISRFIVAIIAIPMLFSGKHDLHIKLEYLVPNWKLIKDIVRIGMPSAGEQVIRALGMAFMMIIVTQFGTPVVAAFGIGMRLLSVVMMPSMGLAIATTTMVGQNLGAGKKKRAENSAIVSSAIALGTLTLVGVVGALFAPWIIGVFTDDIEVIKIGTTFLRITGLSFGFTGVKMVIGGSFRGAGKTMVAMMLSIITLWGLTLPFAQILAVTVGMGVPGLWWGMLLANFIGALIAIMWFRLGKWKTAVIEQETIV